MIKLTRQQKNTPAPTRESTTPSPADLAEALGGKRSANGWMARCPGHDDKSPSLSIGIGRDGQLLLHCFSGCRFEEIIAALRDRGLWPEPTRTQQQQARQRYSLAEIDRAEMIIAIAVADLRKGMTLSDDDREAVRRAWGILRGAGRV